MIAIYSRQSLDKKDSISIETQIEFCKKEIQNNEPYKIYKDKGFSGKNIQRPAFKELFSDIENGKISKLIVYRLDRISRSITDFANIIEFLEEYKVDFVSANEKFDTATPVGRAMLYIIMVFAQLERETIAERIKDSYYSRGKSGIWLGGVAPFGFDIIKTKINDKKVSILSKNADIEIVVEIFNTYSNTNSSLGMIAKTLRESHGGTWTNVKVARILSNPIYVKCDADIYTYYKSKKCVFINEIDEFNGKYGAMIYGKRENGSSKYNSLENQVISLAKNEAVIDSFTFLKCQSKMNNNKQIKNTGKGKHSFLTGIIKCGYCGYSMQVKLYNDKKYLNCTGKYTTDLCKDKLDTHYVNEIEDFIFEQIKKFFENLTSFDIDEKIYTNDIDNNSLKIQLIKIDEEIKSYLEKIPKANDVLVDYINNKVSELDKEKKEIELKLNNSSIPTNSFTIPDVKKWPQLDILAKRDIAQILIETVFIKNDTIKIIWKY